MTAAYCAKPDVEFMLSRFGLQAFLNETDASAPVLAGRLASAINWASTRIDFYLRMRYDPLYLTGNDYVRWAAALFCAVMIVRRKNQEHAGLSAEFDEIKDQLTQIQEFQAEVPGAYPISELGAWSSNVRIDQRFFQRKIRVSTETSTNQQTSVKDRFFDPLDCVLEF